MNQGDSANRTRVSEADARDSVFHEEAASGVRRVLLAEESGVCSRADATASTHGEGALPEIPAFVSEGLHRDSDTDTDTWSEARYVQLGLDGQPSCASDGFRGWLTSRRLAALSGAVRMANGAQRAQARVDGVDVQLVRMHHRAGSNYLAVLTKREAPPKAQRLSQMQRRVATLAAQGATAQQISAQLSVSTNTVKFHLKRVYELLNVSNRVELSRALFCSQAEPPASTSAQP